MEFPQIRTRALATIDLPVQFSRLRDIAYNMWWSWSASAQALFEMIDPSHWQHYRSPIEVLIDLEPERWQDLQNDDGFVRAYRALVDEFDQYMFPQSPTWFQRHHPNRTGPFAYFSTEYGWHESLQIYSGGLGILSGDHSKSASDLGLPFIGLGLCYRRGYFHQTVDAEGQQQHFYPDYDVNRLPLLPVLNANHRDLRVALELQGREVWLRAWKASVGRVPVLLLDTDLPENQPADRAITDILYISGRDMRLCQEIVLGIGGVQVLKALGIEPEVWHLNEGHSALMSLQRLADQVQHGRSLEEARAHVARSAVFTTHTPVPAGNETFDTALVRSYFQDWGERYGIDVDALLSLGHPHNDQTEQFNLTALAIRTTSRANGVSKLHGDVADAMWRGMLEAEGQRKMEYITNGVHLPTWIGRETAELLRNYVGKDFLERLEEPDFPEAVLSIPDAELWEAHRIQKRRLILLVRERVLAQFSRHGHSPDQLRQVTQLLDPDVLLIGFARRFATYKRADLLLRDMERMHNLVSNADRPVQFLFAGKAHPADKPGQELIRKIFQGSLSPELQGRLLFLEGYDIRIGRGMVQGVDVWLNNPLRPLEASGTSGMKAAINGGLNCSVLDGWWCEGYDPTHGWTIGTQSSEEATTDEDRDRYEAESLYKVFEDEIVPCYYNRNDQGVPAQWTARMKQSIAQLSPRFSTSRMVREYTERYYLGVGDVEAAVEPG